MLPPGPRGTWRSGATAGGTGPDDFSAVNRELRPVDGPPAAYKRGRFGEICVYYCTAAMFEKLRHKVGDKRFDALVRRWPQTHLNQNASRRDYVAWVEAETGRELSGFFRSWLLKKRWP